MSVPSDARKPTETRKPVILNRPGRRLWRAGIRYEPVKRNELTLPRSEPLKNG
jgi:hypothetical protein